MEMVTQKLFVGGKTQATICCAKCGNLRNMKVSEIQTFEKPVALVCECGHAFSVLFDKRAYYRKPTSLAGTYSKSQPGAYYGEMLVQDISRTGLRFQPVGTSAIKPGDVLKVEFRLDNEKKALIRMNVIVRQVTSSDVGAEYAALDEYTQKELGFYVMP